MSKICDYVYCDGHDVICSITNTVLGDIMGYNGKNAIIVFIERAVK